MPRAKTLTTKVKEAVIASETVAIAVENARAKVRERREKGKNWVVDLLEEPLKNLDILEATAILGTTYLIKNGIDWTEEIVTSAQSTSFINVFKWLLPPVDRAILDTIFSTPEKVEQTRSALSTPQAEVMEWIISFTCAFLIVRNFGAISSKVLDVIGMAKGLLALGK